MAIESGALLVVASLLLTARGTQSLFGLTLLALVLVAPIIRFLRFRYSVGDHLLVVEGGLLFTWRREIPFARIQSIDTVQKLRHRIFDVVELRIEAVGGGSTEASFPALTHEEADRLRSILASSEQEASSEETALARMTSRDLVLAGVTGGRVPIIAALVGYVVELLPERVATRLFERVGESEPAEVAVAITAFLIVSLLVSLIATVLAYWDFTVERDGGRLIVTRGLFDRRRSLVPVHRIQAVRLHANPIRRILGVASLSVVLAGYSPKDRGERQETSMLLPVGRRIEVLALARRVLDAPHLGSEGLQSAPVQALLRRVVAATTLALPPAAWAIAVLRGGIAPAFALVAIACTWAWGTWRSLGHAIREEHAVVRRGAVFRRFTSCLSATFRISVSLQGPCSACSNSPRSD